MLSVEAHVTNDGSDSTWPASDAGPYPILLGARTFRGDEVNAAGEYRKTFAEPLAARQSTTLRIDVGPFTQPGTYRLSIGVVQERVAWFAGARELTVRVSDE
jgi:hypothetical protein